MGSADCDPGPTRGQRCCGFVAPPDLISTYDKTKRSSNDGVVAQGCVSDVSGAPVVAK